MTSVCAHALACIGTTSMSALSGDCLPESTGNSTMNRHCDWLCASTTSLMAAVMLLVCLLFRSSLQHRHCRLVLIVRFCAAIAQLHGSTAIAY